LNTPEKGEIINQRSTRPAVTNKEARKKKPELIRNTTTKWCCSFRNCPAKFPDSSKLRIHERRHKASSSKYKCTKCSYGVDQEFNFRKHQSLHEKNEPTPNKTKSKESSVSRPKNVVLEKPKKIARAASASRHNFTQPAKLPARRSSDLSRDGNLDARPNRVTRSAVPIDEDEGKGSPQNIVAAKRAVVVLEKSRVQKRAKVPSPNTTVVKEVKVSLQKMKTNEVDEKVRFSFSDLPRNLKYE
jgi:hypothetical protein